MKDYILLAYLIVLFPLPGHGQIDSTRLFEESRKQLPHPVTSFQQLSRPGINQSFFGGDPAPGVIYHTNQAAPVLAIFEGKVISVFQADKMYGVITRFGGYFITYYGLSKPMVQKGEYIKGNQFLAKLAAGPERDFELQLIISTAKENLDPSPWLKESSGQTL